MSQRIEVVLDDQGRLVLPALLQGIIARTDFACMVDGATMQIAADAADVKADCKRGKG